MEKLKDLGYALGKGIIASIPVGGSLASELLSVLIAPPLERRREELFTSIGERLLALEQSERIDLDKLKDDKLFLDIVLHACQNAIKTSDADKITYYKNVVENTALCEAPDKAICHIYLNAIDRYTSWHVKTLVLFDNPVQWFKRNGLNQLVLQKGTLSSIAGTAYPELAEQKGFYDLISSELQRDGMLGSDTLQTMMYPGTALQGVTTEFGKGFLRFIKSQG